MLINERFTTFAVRKFRRGTKSDSHLQTIGYHLNNSLKIQIRMYAIVEIAGQQFKVEKDQKIFVHRLDKNEGEEVEFEIEEGPKGPAASSVKRLNASSTTW